MRTLEQIDPHAFRREGIHPSIADRWSSIRDCDLSRLENLDVVRLIEAAIGIDDLVPEALARIESLESIFRVDVAEQLIGAVIAAPASYWIGRDAEIESVSRIALKLNREMAQHEYYTAKEGSLRDWLHRITNNA